MISVCSLRITNNLSMIAGWPGCEVESIYPLFGPIAGGTKTTVNATCPVRKLKLGTYTARLVTIPTFRTVM